MAAQTFKEALGEGIWVSFLNGSVDCSTFSMQYRDLSPFHQLEEDGASLNLPWDKVTILFNYATLLEQLRDTEKASILYQFILFKVLPPSQPLCICARACVLSVTFFFNLIIQH